MFIDDVIKGFAMITFFFCQKKKKSSTYASKSHKCRNLQGHLTECLQCWQDKCLDPCKLTESDSDPLFVKHNVANKRHYKLNCLAQLLLYLLCFTFSNKIMSMIGLT